MVLSAKAANAENWAPTTASPAFIYPNLSTTSVVIGATAQPTAPVKFQVVGGEMLIDNNRNYQAKNSAGAVTSLIGLSTGNNLNFGSTNVTSMSWNIAGTIRASLTNAGWFGIGPNAPMGPFDVRLNAAASGAGAPIVLSAQAGAASNVGGNLVLNTGANGTGSVNGSILFGTGGTVAAGGVLSNGERMRLDPTGKLGIGLTNPANALHIRRDEGIAAGEKGWLSSERTGTGGTADPAFGIGYRADGTNPTRVWFGAGNSFPLDFHTSSTPQAMSILNNGNVGIGNPLPGFKLDVEGAVAPTGSIRISRGFFEVDGINANGAASGGTNNLRIGYFANGKVGFNLQGTERFTLMTNGNVGVNVSQVHGGIPQTVLEANGSGVEGGAVRITNGYFEVDGVDAAGASSGGTDNLRIGYFASGRVGMNLQGNEVLSMKTDGKVGIGITAPSSTLDVNGTALVRGAMAVGTSTQAASLEVNGSTNLKGSTNIEGDGQYIGSLYSTTYNDFWKIYGTGNASNNGALHIQTGDDNSEPILFEQMQSSGAAPAVVSVRMAISANHGYVGIGTESPSERLEVAGNMKVSGSLSVQNVITNSWSITPDYVFEKGYKLASLDQVEDFVETHKHLPEVPSAKELSKKGMDLAEMNVTLLKKVEELTLYSIQQNKKIESLNDRLSRIEKGSK